MILENIFILIKEIEEEDFLDKIKSKISKLGGGIKSPWFFSIIW